MNSEPVAFPCWQPSYAEYAAVCRYLGLTPQARLYPMLCRHLAREALTHPPLSNWARHLAERPRTPGWIARMDVVSRLFMPTHPVRYLLNGVMALHECTAQGYAEMASTPTGAGVWWRLPLWLAGALAQTVLALAWFVGQGTLYALTRSWRQPAPGLAGRRILITGVGRGLGRDLAMAVLERGGRVVGVLRDRRQFPTELLDLIPDARLTLIETDLSQPGSLVARLRAQGLAPTDIDLAILSAGMKQDGTSVLDPTSVRQTFEVNLFANVDLAAWYFTQGGQGPIVLISSMGRWHGMPHTSGYNASKAALSIWGESLEMERIARGQGAARILIVEPGLFASGMVGDGGLKARLSVSRPHIARMILDAALRGRRSLRPPVWFAWLTWALVLSGRGLRARLLVRARSG